MELIDIDGSWVTLRFHSTDARLMARAFRAATGWLPCMATSPEAGEVDALAMAFEAAALAAHMQGASDAEDITLASWRQEAKKVKPRNDEAGGGSMTSSDIPDGLYNTAVGGAFDAGYRSTFADGQQVASEDDAIRWLREPARRVDVLLAFCEALELEPPELLQQAATE